MRLMLFAPLGSEASGMGVHLNEVEVNPKAQTGRY